MTGRGVPAVARTPFQPERRSRQAGFSDGRKLRREAERLAVETARPRMRPALICGSPAGPTANMTWSWPEHLHSAGRGLRRQKTVRRRLGAAFVQATRSRVSPNGLIVGITSGRIRLAALRSIPQRNVRLPAAKRMKREG